MRRLTLPTLALSLVFVGCGPSEPVAKNSTPASPQVSTPTEPSKITPPATSQSSPNTPNQQTPPEDPKKLIEEVKQGMEKNKSSLAISPRGYNGWLPGTTKAEVVAAEAEKKLASLSNISGVSQTHMEILENKAMNISQVAIKDPKRFYIEYLNVKTAPQTDVEKQALVGDGTSYATNALSTKGWSSAVPISNLKGEATKSTLDSWALTFHRNIFSALQGGKPITTLVTAAQKAGLDVTTEEIFKESGGRQIRQKRILISRPAAQLEKKGPFTYEVVVDQYRKLPVTIRVDIQHPKQPPLKVMWTMRWNLDPTQKFSPEAFKIPSAGQAAQKMAGSKKL